MHTQRLTALDQAFPLLHQQQEKLLELMMKLEI